MSIGTFALIKNEIEWIEDHVENVAPHVDEMIFFDGESTDGTLEVLRAAHKKYPHVKVFEKKDPQDLRDDYVRLSNEALHSLDTDWGVFLHPDMFIENPKQFQVARDRIGQTMSMHMTSYAGEPGQQLYRIHSGRSKAWKNIYRLRNPDLGAHYFGWYGEVNEDVYFSKITGDAHEFFGPDFNRYPYEVDDSGLRCHHFSDVRPYKRRFERMVKCLTNQGAPAQIAEDLARNHPRVSLVAAPYFKLTPCEDPRAANTERKTANV